MMNVRHSGFTLLEIMLVIVLLGLASSIAITSLLPSREQVLYQESERLLETLRFVSHQAEIQHKIYGVIVTPHHWQIVTLAPRTQQTTSVPPSFASDYQWQTVKHNSRLLSHQLPENIILDVAIEQSHLQDLSADSLTLQQPSIFILPGGETSDFTLTLIETSSHQTQQLAMDSQGQIEWATPLLPQDLSI